MCGISRIAFAPAQTTITGVLVNSGKSAEMSKVSEAPRCTPPIPPVAKNFIPARLAHIIVAATVVAAFCVNAKTEGKSRLEAFFISLPVANLSKSRSFIPIFILPSSMAMVAGTPPFSRTVFSSIFAVSIF